jgi:hypothetical protein
MTFLSHLLGCALPITEVLTSRIPTKVYQGFYVYLYLGSIAFVVFVYATHMKSRAVYSVIKSYRKLSLIVCVLIH